MRLARLQKRYGEEDRKFTREQCLSELVYVSGNEDEDDDDEEKEEESEDEYEEVLQNYSTTRLLDY